MNDAIDVVPALKEPHLRHLRQILYGDLHSGLPLESRSRHHCRSLARTPHGLDSRFAAPTRALLPGIRVRIVLIQSVGEKLQRKSRRFVRRWILEGLGLQRRSGADSGTPVGAAQ